MRAYRLSCPMVSRRARIQRCLVLRGTLTLISSSFSLLPPLALSHSWALPPAKMQNMAQRHRVEQYRYAYGSLQSLRLLSPRPWRRSLFNSKKLYSLFPPLCSFPSSPHSPLVDVSSTWSWLSPSVAPTKAHFSRSLPPASPLIQWLQVLRPRAP